MQSGMSLPETMIAVAVMGITVAGLAGAFKFSLNSNASVNERADINRIRSDLLNSLSCSRTISSLNQNSDCTSGAFTHATGYSSGPYIIPLNDSNEALFANSRYGGWEIRTRCVKNASLNSLIFYTSRRANDSAKVDSLTGKSHDWQPLFGAEIRFCERELLGTKANAATVVAPAMALIGGSYNWSNSNSSVFYHYNSNYFADFNHHIGRFAQVQATCPDDYVPVSTSSANYHMYRCRPSKISYSADLSIQTATFGCAFDNIGTSTQDITLSSVPMTTTCVRIR